MALKGVPDTAFPIACRMAHVVKTLVERPIHVATVKGLKRKLFPVEKVSGSYGGKGGTHTRLR